MEEPGHAPVVHTVPDQADLSAICARIGAARSRSDFLAVSVHMGRGFGEDLAEYEPLVGRALIDAGADVVFGNHVHAIHGIESYAGRAILMAFRRVRDESALSIIDCRPIRLVRGM